MKRPFRNLTSRRASFRIHAFLKVSVGEIKVKENETFYTVVLCFIVLFIYVTFTYWLMAFGRFDIVSVV